MCKASSDDRRVGYFDPDQFEAWSTKLQASLREKRVYSLSQPVADKELLRVGSLITAIDPNALTYRDGATIWSARDQSEARATLFGVLVVLIDTSKDGGCLLLRLKRECISAA